MNIETTNLAKEAELQKACIKYLQFTQSDVIYTSNVNAAIKLNHPLAAKRAKEMGNTKGIPDLMIFKAKKGYNALFVEFKRKTLKIYKRNGQMIKNKHLQFQLEIHQKLRNEGYFVAIVQDFDKFTELINWYFDDDTN